MQHGGVFYACVIATSCLPPRASFTIGYYLNQPLSLRHGHLHKHGACNYSSMYILQNSPTTVEVRHASVVKSDKILRLIPWIQDFSIFWICLLLARNGWTDIHQIIGICWTWTKEQLARLFHAPQTRRDGVCVSNITENGRSDMTQGIIRNILGMLRLTPWIQGVFLFSGSVFVSNEKTNGWISHL